jgi:integral membrane protein
MKNSALQRFRLVALLEGISYLILLFICMPLKYLAHYKNAVLYFGWIHGILFIAFMVLLLQVWIKYKWSFGKVLFAFIASLLPFGTFVLDRRLKKEAE